MQAHWSTVFLKSPSYFAVPDGGPVSFTINIWFKVTDSSGGLFQYMLSHMGPPDFTQMTDDAAYADWTPHQVPIMHVCHPAYIDCIRGFGALHSAC